MGGPKEPTTVAGIEFDALIDRSEEHTASVPQYPVDAGYSISDNVALEPMQLRLTLYVTATPVTWMHRHGSGEQRVENICRQLLSLYESRNLVSVVTPYEAYDNMVIRSLSIKDTVEQGYAREIPVEFVQVTVTNARSVAVPSSYARSGSTMENTGKASSQTASDTAPGSAANRQNGVGIGSEKNSNSENAAQKGNSLLYDLADGIGKNTGWFNFGE